MVGSPLTVKAQSSEHVATITRIFGKVKILVNPKPQVQGKGPHVLVEDQYYTLLKGKKGMKIPENTLIQTSRAARVRIIYDNGDQFSVGSNTSYIVNTGGKKQEKKTVMKLFFGTVRSTIEKGGPRADLEVKTRTMSMGVRGTDFHVSTLAKAGGTAITVLRGKVAVKDANQKNAKPVIIPRGFSAEVKAAPIPTGKKGKKDAAPPPPAIVLEKTTKEKLVKVQKTSQIKKSSDKTQPTDPALAKKLEKLEKQAVKVVMKDIKAEDPKLYEDLKKSNKNLDNIDAIQTETVKKAYKEAPKATKVAKPDEEDLDLSDDEIYDKYFE